MNENLPPTPQVVVAPQTPPEQQPSPKPSIFKKLFSWPSHHKKVILPVFAILIIGLIGWVLYSQVLNRGQRVKVAAGNIILKPTQEDRLGVAKDSDYVLTSKELLKASDVKQSLKIKPEQNFDVSQVNDKEVKISLKKDLSEGKIYQFQLATAQDEASGSASQKDLSWAFQIKSPFRIINTLPRDESTSVPINSGIEITFSHDNYQDIDSFFEISPNVGGRFERHKRTAVFVPQSLKLGTLYTVTLKKGLKLDGADETLNEDYVFQFETTSADDSGSTYRIGFVREMSEFPSTEKPAFSLYSSSQSLVPTLDVEVYKFSDINQFVNSLKEREKIPSWAYYSHNTHVQDTSKLQKVTTFNAPIQSLNYYGYFVMPQPLPEGFYLVATKTNNQIIQNWLQITDIATYLSTSNTKTIAWINDVQTKKPVSGAKVELIDGKESAQTGADGAAFFNTPKELVDSKDKRYFKISAGNKQAVVPVEQTNRQYYWRSHDYQGTKGEKFWSYLSLDRPVYQPQDKVGFWGMIKDRDDNKTVENVKVLITRSDYRDYNYNPIAIQEKEVTPNEFGTFIGQFELKNLQTGYYNVELRQGDEVLITKYFSIETYSKPAYKIDLEPTKKAIFAGDSVDFKGKTVFFEGTPVSNVDLNYNGVANGFVTSDQKGDFKIVYNSTYTEPQDGYYNPYPRSDYLGVTPANAETGEIEGGAYVTVFGPHITLKTTTDVTDDKGVVKITSNNITLDRLNNNTNKDSEDYLAGPYSGPITGQLYENTWEKTEIGESYDFINKQTVKQYDYKNIKTKISDINISTDSNGQAAYEFPLAQDKYYQVDLQASDGQGRTVKNTVYIYGRQGSNPDYSNSAYTLQSEKRDTSTYSVGDKVNLTFRKGQEDLPTGGDNNYLFSLAQRGFRSYKVQDNPNFGFDYSQEFVPDVIAKAIYFTGNTYIEGESSTLSFTKTDKKLDIEVKLDKSSYEPQDTVNLSVSVKDKNGSGQKSDVNLSLVDEAIYKIAYSDVDTLGDLYEEVSSGVIQSYLSHQYPQEPNGAEGGGCFLSGTKILLPDKSYKNIEDIKPGDEILTRESPSSAALVSAKVKNVQNHLVQEYLLVNGKLRVTPEHNLYVNGRWMVAADLMLGDHLLTDTNKWVEVTSIEKHTGKFDVYNFEVAGQRTYFAEDFYVHNEKGRELFADTAYFGAVKTDSSGNGKVSFKLPDNLTSWRITAQGISDTLGAGQNTKLLPVKLPFFVDAVMATEYLEGDKPQIVLRSFGENLKAGQQVDFEFQAESLGVKDPKKLSAKAFESVTLDLPPLTEGEHKISISGKSGKLEDKLIKTIKVYKTRLTKADSNFETLSADTKPTGGKSVPTVLIFSDQNRGRFYPILTDLLYTYGDRVDQKVARVKSKELLEKYFNEKTFSDENFNPENYQTPEGGISLFPYSADELELTAKMASLQNNPFDEAALKQYFYKILDNQKEGTERTAISLYGLASLQEPVLVYINSILQRTDLTIKDKLFLGLAEAKIGNVEKGREILREVLNQYGEDFKPLIRIKTGRDQDDILEATALATNLASLTGEPQGENLYGYTLKNATKDILVYLEQLLYAENTIPTTSSDPVQFTYNLNGKSESKKLSKGETFKLQVNPEDLSQIKFDNIQGNVGLTSLFRVPFSSNDVRKDDNLKLTRTYTVNGQNTTNFSETDNIAVTLNYQIGNRALDGCYQVTDLLPSGLKPITKLYSRGITDPNAYYPYDITGQRVNFCVGKGNLVPTITYYARVIGKGEFQAEPATIQSQQSTDALNISDPATVKIK